MSKLIYVASSWRNSRQPKVVRTLRRAGFTVYDFRNPSEDDHGFQWSEIDPQWQEWDVDSFAKGLQHPLAREGLRKDRAALDAAAFCLLVMPCGRSAHLELGYAIGAGKMTGILLPIAWVGEPELMYGMADSIHTSMQSVIEWIKHVVLGCADGSDQN